MRRGAVLFIALTLIAGVTPGRAHESRPPGEVELVGVFHAGGSIRGAAIHEGYLYVSTPDRFSIYKLEDPEDPQLESTVPSPRLIHGELVSTNGELLLLNEQAVLNDNGVTGGRTVDVWDVEDKSNPKLVGTVPRVFDEHPACILDCKWAYGSEGAIIDLREPSKPVLRKENWIELAGLKGLELHRVDEYRNGFVATAPRGWAPMTIDVRNPLRPRVERRTTLPLGATPGYLFSDWPKDGRSRYLFTSTEYPDSGGDCRQGYDGALVAFDMRKPRAPLASQFSIDTRDGCTGYYFSFHPNFERTGLVALPQSLGGVRVVRFEPGRMADMGSFVPLVTDMWLTFWIDTEFFYALSMSGEIYILRYVP